MPDWIDLAGTVIGELTVLHYAGWRKWTCRCACGRTVEKHGHRLRSGTTRVCSKTFHAKRSVSRFPIEYRAWQNAKRRKKLCEDWHRSFDAFHEGVGDRPSPELSLVRPDERKLMGPSNFAWINHTKRRHVYEDQTMHSAQEVMIAEALEAHPLVETWSYETERVPYDHKGRARVYEIDFSARLTDGTELHLEIKPVGGTKPRPLDRVKWAAARALFGERFIVATALTDVSHLV
jgi:hypothetical protein